ncbi:MAG: hypothetical protein HY318_11115 [Armatimonadetes bacterium]|nr:hypothetical protein [Armatimonadota bacterium]
MQRAAALIFCVGMLSVLGQRAARAEGTGQNLALRRTYECVTPPNYWGWKGPWHGDKGQLADGRVLEAWIDSEGKPFYALPGTAGWTSTDPAVLVFDLGETRSIGGVGLHSVLSPWGPWWPEAVTVLVSDDNADFYLAASTDAKTESSRRSIPVLVPAVSREVVQAAIDRTFQEKGISPTTHWYRAEGIAARGRYVSLIMTPSASTGTLVLDEIEIYEGGAEPPPLRSSQVFTEGKGGWQSYLLYGAVSERLSRDLRGLREKVMQSRIPKRERRDLEARLGQLDKQRSAIPVPKLEGFRAILPINDFHRAVFKIQSALWESQRAPILRVWHGHRWDPLAPLQDPIGQSPKIAIVMAGNEVRSDVLNLTNAAQRDCAVELTFTGLPSESLEVFEIPFVDTRSFEPVATAMIPAEKRRGAYVIHVPAGMTRQVWVRCSSRKLKARRYTGWAVLKANVGKGFSVNVPASIEVVPVKMPGRFSLHVGGWDYAVDQVYGVTAKNREAFVALLREYGVNTPWAGNGVMPLGGYDDKGNLTQPPSRNLLDQWLRMWPDANLYCVVGSDLPLPLETPNRLKRVEAWASDWDAYLKNRGVPSNKLAILIRDEPTTTEELQTILEVGRAIKRGAPGFKIWNDLHFADPATAPPILEEVMRESCDIQCFNRQHYQQQSQANDAFVAKHRRPGLEWWTYTAGANSRLSDPYIDWLLQEWFCFDKGLTGSHFWAFGDSGGGFSWNEYLNSRGAPTPIYLAVDSVTTSKSMEALREGMQDYELLLMLEKELSSLSGDQESRVTRARQVLRDGLRQVLAIDDKDHWQWSVPKDRSTADRVRERILRVMLALKSVESERMKTQ